VLLPPLTKAIVWCRNLADTVRGVLKDLLGVELKLLF